MREDELEILQGRRYASLVADVDGEVDSWSNCATSVLDHVGTTPVPVHSTVPGRYSTKSDTVVTADVLEALTPRSSPS